jgi:hypothetical protein
VTSPDHARNARPIPVAHDDAGAASRNIRRRDQRGVRRACAFIDANLDQDLTLQSIGSLPVLLPAIHLLGRTVIHLISSQPFIRWD